MSFSKKFKYRLLNVFASALMILFFSYNGFAANTLQGNDMYCEKYCGIWTYYDKQRDSQSYFQITRDKLDKFKFRNGGNDYEHRNMVSKKYIVWYGDNVFVEDLKGNRLKGIYLKPSNGKLKGIFFSSNFWATHSIIQSIEITIESKSRDKLIYSERGVIGEKTKNLGAEPPTVYEATRLDE